MTIYFVNLFFLDNQADYFESICVRSHRFWAANPFYCSKIQTEDLRSIGMRQNYLITIVTQLIVIVGGFIQIVSIRITNSNRDHSTLELRSKFRFFRFLSPHRPTNWLKISNHENFVLVKQIFSPSMLRLAASIARSLQSSENHICTRSTTYNRTTTKVRRWRDQNWSLLIDLKLFSTAGGWRGLFQFHSLNSLSPPLRSTQLSCSLVCSTCVHMKNIVQQMWNARGGELSWAFGLIFIIPSPTAAVSTMFQL